MQHSRKQNINILLRTLGRYVTHGPAKKTISDPKNIVVIQSTRNLGDMIVTTPVFRAVKKQFPNSKLFVVGTEKNRETVRGNKDIDEYIGEPETADALIQTLKEKNIDYGCSINPSVIDVAAMYLGGIPSIATFALQNERGMSTKSYDLIKHVAFNLPFQNGVYIPREYLKLLEPLGIHTDITKKYLVYTNAGDQTVESQLTSAGINSKADFIVAISPGAGTKIKQWPPERFAETANFMAKNYGAKIAVIGGGKDRSEIDGVIAKFDKEVVYQNFFNQSLDEMKSLLSKCHLIVANDSGPVYIAESFEVPTLVVVGPTDEAEHPPKGPRNRIVKAPDRGEALMGAHIAMDYDAKEARRQIEAVTIEMVTDEIDDLMKVIGKSPLRPRFAEATPGE